MEGPVVGDDDDVLLARLAWLLEQSGPWLAHRLTGNHQNRPISANHSAATRAGLVTSLKAAEAPTV